MGVYKSTVSATGIVGNSSWTLGKIHDVDTICVFLGGGLALLLEREDLFVVFIPVIIGFVGLISSVGTSTGVSFTLGSGDVR